MKKILIVISLLGFLFACTPPMERVYSKETATSDMKEIKKLIVSSDYELLENMINDHAVENERELKNKTYNQILESIKAKIKEEREIELERQRLVREQPIQFLHATDTGFEKFSFKLFGNETKTVGYRLKGSLINMSDKTFVKTEFANEDDSFWADAKRNPYVEIILTDTFRLSCIDFGPRFDNWDKVENIVLPTASYEHPWKAHEIKDFEMYFQPDVTCGYYLGVDDYGECPKPIHFNYEPNSCLLKIPIYLEDANGYKKQMFLTFDIMNDFKNFAKNDLKKDKTNG